MAKPEVRNIFSSYDDPGLDCSGDIPLTKQADAQECDINFIMERALKGIAPAVVREPGLYGDYAAVGDFQASMEVVLRAQEQFDGLDAKVRDRFQNDPSQLLAFVNDGANRAEAISLGLVEAPITPPSPAAPASVPAST